ncbi:beta-N-acetylhexosaminidase [Marinobacterium iners]|uniref:Beta-hexosaminidase n=1 Tax=Marinobacterium iners DSM 11526 TaxID=1122198 RepID=A0A1H4B8R1_9GAMM|nr:beta-N-acetylhexosaminidase [Marinobacterium iners]SEA44553.1 beta-N-acetylhexosaminidase [Marinobacterium iners DSM 11526]
MTTGVLMLDIEGTALNAVETEQIKSPQVGGLILFSRNYDNPDQLKSLMTSIRALRADLLVAVDQEGGRVQRFHEGFTRLPPMAALGRRWLQNPHHAIACAHELGWLMATELRRFDIDISFAPVLDLDWGQSSVIGDRAFGADPEVVIQLAGGVMAGMHEAGMAATGKHFPGHGWVQADSHLELPIDERSMAEIEEQDLRPFDALIRRGLDGVMPAHVVYSQVCSAPAGFSSYWLQQVLRQRLHFDGVIFSDDLSMEGASQAGSYAERCDRALAAGCDMVLVCNHPDGAGQVLEHLQAGSVAASHRLARMRARPARIPDSDRLNESRQLAAELLKEI